MKQTTTYARGTIRQLLIGFIVAVFAITGLSLGRAHAAGSATLSLSPATKTVTNGTTFTTNIIENSGSTGINTVEADLNYDQSKLQFVSVTVNTTAFKSTLGASGGSGKVTVVTSILDITNPNPPTPLTGQQTVATVTFKAIAAGSASVSFANTSAVDEASDSADILGSTTPATYTITAVAATCPSGYTGTPPNCVAPTQGGGSTSGTSSGSGTKSTSNDGSKSSTSTGDSKSSTSTGNSSKSPTTPQSTPITTATDAGTTAATLRVSVHYKDGKPIANSTVSLHSQVQTVTTDANGIATFTNVPFGDHEVTYTQGGKTYSQALSIGSLEAENSSVIAVTFPVNQRANIELVAFSTIIALLALVVGAYAIFKLRQRRGIGGFPAMGYGPTPVATVGSATAPPVTFGGNQEKSSTDELLQKIESPQSQPGITVTPSSTDTENQNKEGM